MPTSTRSPAETISSWFLEQVPADWFSAPVDVRVDREEILVIGSVPTDGDDAGQEAHAACIAAFRERTRDARIEIALAAERTFGRKVSWGASCGETTLLFTTLSVPVMTRLRMPERRILDTLVAAGVARSRSDALGWCVRLVAEHEGEWLADLRDALEAVERVKAARDASPR